MAVIRDTAALTALIGHPRPAVERKFHDRLTPQAVEFLGRSPLAFLATVDEAGQPMVSPKGDQPGFIRPDGDRIVLLPERSGNRLVFTLRNIVANGRLAIIALAPGTGETLRLEGEAELDDAPLLCAGFRARDRDALLVIRLRLQRCYFHCAKSLLRSSAWPMAAAAGVSFGQEIAANGGLTPGEIEGFDAAVRERYVSDL
jgi:PPOX class probable FMN-dependent enzyme